MMNLKAVSCDEWGRARWNERRWIFSGDLKIHIEEEVESNRSDFVTYRKAMPISIRYLTIRNMRLK